MFIKNTIDYYALTTLTKKLYFYLYITEIPYENIEMHREI